MAALAKLFRLIAASVIPGGGFLIGSWSPATALTLYWVDNLIGAITMGVRIALHRRWTGLAGHSRAHIGATHRTGVGRDKGESFEAYWRRTRAEEEAQAKQDEGVG